MKKILLLSIFATLLAACSSCGKTNSPADASDIDASLPTTKEVVGDNYKFSFPSYDWDTVKTDGSSTSFYYLNEKQKNIVVFLEEYFSGTTQDYALIAIRGMKQSGAVFTASSQVKMNNIQYILIESNNKSNKIYQWVTVKDKMGYGLSCGGEDNDLLLTTCKAIANSLSFK